MPRVVIAVLLNHAGASVTDIYTRAGLWNEKRRAVERLGELVSGTPPGEDSAKVVYLQR